MKEERIAFILDNGITCTVNSVSTTAVIGRVSKRTSVFSWENERIGSFLPDVNVPGGALVENGIISEAYLVRSIYQEFDSGEVACKTAQLLKINATTNILRYSESYDEFGNAIPESGAWKDTVTGNTAILTPVKAFAEWISAAMRQAEPGLLSTTVIRLYVQATNVMQLLDRVMLGGKPYQLDAIDPFSNPGLAVVQLSQDNRG